MYMLRLISCLQCSLLIDFPCDKSKIINNQLPFHPPQRHGSIQICVLAHWQQFLTLLIQLTMSKVKDPTIDAIIKKYQHRQQAIRSGISLAENDSQDTARMQRRESGLSTPEFSFTVGKKEMGRKMEEEQRIQRTMKKEEGNMRQEASFSTDRQLQVVLRQLEDAEQRLARSQRNFAQASRRCEQLQRREKETEMENRLKRQSSGDFQARLTAVQRENLNFRECIATKDSNLEILRQKLGEKNERLMESERIVSDLKAQLLYLSAKKEKTSTEEDATQKQKQQLIKRLKSEVQTLHAFSRQREDERKELLQEMQRAYRSHQEQLQVVRQSYIQVEEEYKQWINNCNSQKLALIAQYQHKLANNKNSVPPRKEAGFEEQLQRRQRESSRLITITAKQSQQLKSLRSEIDSLQRVKTQLVIKVSSLQNTLIDRAEVLSSIEAAYSALQLQYRQQEEKGRDLRQRYNAVNRQFLELKGKCSALFQSRQASKRESRNENAELVKLRKELWHCREQLQRSRSNETALGVKVAQSTKTVKDRLVRLQQEREQSLTELLAERLQNARLQQELQQTRQHLKRQYELSVQNTRKQLERQITSSNSKTSRVSTDPQKQQLYLQLRALQRKYQLLAEEIVTVDEVIGLATKVKRRHEPLKKSHLQ